MENSENVIDWFKKIKNKSNYVFIVQTAIPFAEDYVEITVEEKRIIYHCRKSLLFYKIETWKKKDTDSCFDIIIGSYDGAELCEFIGIYLLS